MIDFLSRSYPEPNTGCWLWAGPADPGGYGKVSVSGTVIGAHRASWEQMNGQVPAGKEMHHKCIQPLCCNPDHLVPLTRAEHARITPRYRPNAHKTHCPHGHLLDGDNLRTRPSRSVPGRFTRECRACDAARQKAKYHRKNIKPERL